MFEKGKLSNVEDLWKEFAISESTGKVVKLKSFNNFDNTIEALTTTALWIDSKPSKGLCNFWLTQPDCEILAIVDSKLANNIKEKLKINYLYNNMVMELIRGLIN